MSSQNRRAAARRRAWGRGPIILRFEPLEGRQLLARPLPDLVGDAITVSAPSADWGNSFNVSGTILNQGRGAVPTAFDVKILASSSPTITPSTGVVLDDFSVAPGLGAQQSVHYSQNVTLPPTPIPNFTAGKPIYIATYIAPGHQIAETDYRNNYSVGLNIDTASLNIVAQPPAQLLGTSFAPSTTATTWGQQVTVSAQIVNDAQGDAPPTRAAIILTPAGVAPGSGQDVTVGYLNVPAVPAWQTVNVVQTFTLPATAPTVVGSSSQFTLSMVQDADYLTNPMYPHVPVRGLGLDAAQIVIGPGPVSNVTPAPLPDLAASTVQAPTQPLHWGVGFPVSATIQNIGQGVAGPFNVVFFLTGSDGSTANAIFLGETTVSGLASGGSQTIATNLILPKRLPSDVQLNSVGIGRVAMLIDPENVVNESTISNNLSYSNPVTLRLLGSDGITTVPTSAAPGVSLGQPQPQGTLTPSNLTAAQQARAQAQHQRRLHLRATPKKESLTKKVEHKLTVFPKQIGNAFSNLFK